MEGIEQIKAYNSFSGADMAATCHFPAADGSKHIYTLGSMQTLTYSIHMERRPIRAIGNVNAKDYVMGPRTIAGTLIFAVFNKHFAYEAMDGIKEEYDPNYEFLADELPPFDITVSFANEYGARSRMVLYGVRLVNEGQVMSINDIYTENTYQFVAIDIEYMKESDGSYSNLKGASGQTETAKPSKSNAGKEIREAMTISIKSAAVDPEVSVMTIPATETKKGSARFVVSPYDEKGSIKIQWKTMKAPLIVNIAEFKGKPIYLSLAAGSYNVIYRTSGKSSELKSFTISSVSDESFSIVPAPTIEMVSPQSIAIYSSSTKHNVASCSYIDADGQAAIKSVEIAKRRAVITGLTPGTKYSVSTRLNEYQSSVCAVTTPLTDYSQFADLRRYVFYNENYLTQGPLADYLRILDAALALAEDAPLMTVSQALTSYKEQLRKDLVSLNENPPASKDVYDAKILEITTNDNIAMQLLLMANAITNNASWAANLTSRIRPPRPELFDAANNIFLLDDSTEKLEFFRQLGDVSQFAQEVTKGSFFQHSSGKMAYRYIGRPGMSHYVYAINKLGDRSPRLDFYVMKDKDRSDSLAINAGASNSYRTAREELLSKFAKEIADAKVSALGLDLILLQLSRMNSTGVFPAPSIIDKGPNYIRADVHYPDLSIEETGTMYAVLAEVQNIMIQHDRQKIPFSHNSMEVEFRDYPHGIRPDTMYAIWIEDGMGRQLSPAVAVQVHGAPTEELIAEDEAVRMFFWKKTLREIKKRLSSRITITSEVEEILEILQENDEIGDHQIYEELSQNAIRSYPRIPNIDPLLYAIYQTKADLLYRSSPSFFFDPIKTDKSTVLFPDRNDQYVIVKGWIQAESVLWSTMSIPAGVNGVMPMDETTGYVIMFAIDPRTHEKSGILFGNVFNRKFQFYPSSIGGVN